MNIEVKIVNSSGHALPAYETAGAAGMDLRAVLETPVLLEPMERALIPTGLFIELPIGFEAQIRPRSGLAFKHGVTVLNSPGTIDADYRGEVKVLLVNLSSQAFTVNHGERVAQLVVASHGHVQWVAVDQLNDTLRGAGGFGSTGHK